MLSIVSIFTLEEKKALGIFLITSHLPSWSDTKIREESLGNSMQKKSELWVRKSEFNAGEKIRMILIKSEWAAALLYTPDYLQLKHIKHPKIQTFSEKEKQFAKCDISIWHFVYIVTLWTSVEFRVPGNGHLLCNLSPNCTTVLTVEYQK